MMMRKILTGFLALFGFADGSSAQKVQLVDPNTILASISTISDDAAPVVEAGKIGPTDLVFHEDDWRQIEFFPASRRSEIEAKLTELVAFEKQHRSGAYWDKIYVRKLHAQPVLPGAGAVGTIAAALGVQPHAAPVLFYEEHAVVGRVANGFSLPLGRSVALYGFHDSTGIPVLGASVQAGSDDMALSRAFAKLNASHHLIMVDWRGHMLLTGVAPDGNFEVWQP
ncbi:hypothetical protein U1839_00030 [Sphingomonas sp. RT2P30]|uniref:hypothetical protein n=1 Tax=Parasphingomonas halimpatiens TaxID=3096162 RepID=UPI002FC88D62